MGKVRADSEQAPQRGRGGPSIERKGSRILAAEQVDFAHDFCGDSRGLGLKVVPLCISGALSPDDEFEGIDELAGEFAGDDARDMERGGLAKRLHVGGHDVKPIAVQSEAAFVVSASKHGRLTVDGIALVRRGNVEGLGILWLVGRGVALRGRRVAFED